MSTEHKVTIAFATNGGAGTLFVHTNFIYCVHQYISSEELVIVVFGHKSGELNQLVFEGQEFVNAYYNFSKCSKEYEYDACVHLNFYPEVIYENDIVKERLPKLHDLLEQWRAFMAEDPFRKVGVVHPYYDVNAYIYAINNNKNCLNVLDIRNVLGIKKEYAWKLEIKEDKEYLKSLGLEIGKFITIQRGATPNSHQKESPKNWSVSYYEELIRLLKLVYPDIKLVQLGEHKNSETLKGIDIDLLGKTSWKELAVLLKNAWLHVDGECGMVHLREVIGGGPSVVLFGPTPVKFYGYENNINITSTGCKQWCARLTNGWMERCAKGDNTPSCMKEISPSKVLSYIVGWDRLTQVKEGKRDLALQFSNKQLYAESDCIIDKEYKEHYLDSRSIYFYEKKKTKVRELQMLYLSEQGFVYIPIDDFPAYRFLCGEEEVYEAYVKREQKQFYDSIHSSTRFRNLIKALDANEYDERARIITFSENMVLDGHHRAVWLMKRKGAEHEVEVLQLYKLDDETWDFFPYHKIPQNSRIVIYGAGAIGVSYLKQLAYTGYCEVTALLDCNPEQWNVVKTNRENIRCINPSDIRGISYDYVVIASRNDKNATDIRNTLLQLGVEERKIVTQCYID